MLSVFLKFLSAVVLLTICTTKLLPQDEQTQAIPNECAKDVSSDTGTPVFFPLNPIHDANLIWGLSTKLSDYTDSIPIILWVANPTDKPSQVITCPDLSYFWRTGIEVFNSTGNRVTSRKEIQDQNKNEITRKIVICSRTFAINISPHFCKHTTFSKPDFDFYRDISSGWDFKPGHYFISPAERTSEYVPIQRTEKPKIALEINIVPKTH